MNFKQRAHHQSTKKLQGGFQKFGWVPQNSGIHSQRAMVVMRAKKDDAEDDFEIEQEASDQSMQDNFLDKQFESKSDGGQEKEEEPTSLDQGKDDSFSEINTYL